MTARKPSAASLRRKARGLDKQPSLAQTINGQLAVASRYAKAQGKDENLAKFEVLRKHFDAIAHPSDTTVASIKEQASKVTQTGLPGWIQKAQRNQLVGCLQSVQMAAMYAPQAVQTCYDVMTDRAQPGAVRLVAARSIIEWAGIERARDVLNKSSDELTPDEIQAQIEADRKVLQALQTMPNAYAVPEASEEQSEMHTD